MLWQPREPHYGAGGDGPGIELVEARPGALRAGLLESWLRDASASGCRTWLLHCAPTDGGIWSGIADLVSSVVSSIEAGAPALLADHGYEISLVLPEYRGRMAVSRTLTDTASDAERTRNYPADRAYRSLHGLIDLLSEWHDMSGGAPWAIACDDFDQANGLVRRFVTELLRRRGHRLGLRFLLAAAPGGGVALAANLAPAAVTGAFRPPGGASLAPRVGEEDPAAGAEDLERRLEADPSGLEMSLPRLIDCWRRSGRPQRARRWEVLAIHTFNHLGLYEASLEYCDAVEADLDDIRAEDRHLYFVAVNGLFFCLVPLGQVDRARRIVEAALAHLDGSELPRVYYLVAMLHARFLGAPDLEQADAYLQRALDLLPVVELPEDDRHFLTVFLTNGVALVRVRQRRPDDAVALCQAGLAHLDHHLDPGQHRLHRSVLFYNIAQVYAQIGPYEEALEYFGQTMELDPNYSEYYNDRGAVYYKMGRLEEAEQDFLAAIGLSPPYAEVWINLGQCHRAQGRMTEAVFAYSRAIDLEPDSSLAWTGRADAHASLGLVDQSLDDYHTAVRLDPSQPLVWGARAIAYYEKGQVAEALADLDRAVGLAPELGELRQNRAVALQELGRTAEAVADLRRYLELCPDADDRAGVARQLDSLLSAAVR